MQAILAIFDTAFQRVSAVWPLGFVSTQKIIVAEREVERIQSLILSGRTELADFRQAVHAWEKVVEHEVLRWAEVHRVLPGG